MIRFLTAIAMSFLMSSLTSAQEISDDTELCDPQFDLDCATDPDEDDDEPQELSSEPGDIVRLRGLDKVTARTRDFQIEIGQSELFGSLEIRAQYCRRRPPEEPPETFAFLEVFDRRTDGFGDEIEGEKIFSGWMLGSNPALNPLEHPVYDVWVLDCISEEPDLPSGPQ